MHPIKMIQLNAGTKLLLLVSVRYFLVLVYQLNFGHTHSFMFFKQEMLSHIAVRILILCLLQRGRKTTSPIFELLVAVFFFAHRKCFKQDTQQDIFLGYVPHTDCIILYFDKGSGWVKIATHAKFDEGFDDLPVDNLPLNCQQILRLNGTHIPPDKRELNLSDLEFLFIYFLTKKLLLFTFIHPQPMPLLVLI